MLILILFLKIEEEKKIWQATAIRGATKSFVIVVLAVVIDSTGSSFLGKPSWGVGMCETWCIRISLLWVGYQSTLKGL